MAGESFTEPVLSISETEELLLDGSRYGDAEDVQAALEQRVNVNIFDASGRTALHMASANGHVDVVQALIVAGGDVNMRNAQGNTPLHWACVNAHIQVIRLLMEAGADASVLNSYEQTPVDEAVNSRPGDLEMLNLISSFQHGSTHKRATLPSLSISDDGGGFDDQGIEEMEMEVDSGRKDAGEPSQ